MLKCHKSGTKSYSDRKRERKREREREKRCETPMYFSRCLLWWSKGKRKERMGGQEREEGGRKEMGRRQQPT